MAQGADGAVRLLTAGSNAWRVDGDRDEDWHLQASSNLLHWLTLTNFGTNYFIYANRYTLKTDNSTNAWPRLINAMRVLNTAPTNQLRDAVEDVFAVDNSLWFLAIENVFAGDDSS